MRLMISKSPNAQSLYVIKSVFQDGKRTSKIVEKLGTYDELQIKLNGEDPIVWAKNYINELNKMDKEDKHKVMVQYSPTKLIEKDQQHSFNGGYLFLQKIYYELGLHSICKQISDKYKFAFNLNSILSRLIYGRIIFPSSKLATFQLSSSFLEQPDFDIQHVYRALEVISKETDFIQSALYKKQPAYFKAKQPYSLL